METVTGEILIKILDSIEATMAEAKEHLIELDGAMGDGDLGLTMYSGFHAVAEEAHRLDEPDLGKFLMKLGMKMNAVVPSTMGTLVSTCFIKASAKAKGKQELTLADLVAMGRAAVEGVMQRGQSQIGDKTMLDALHPAVEALAAANHEGKNLIEAHQDAYQAALAGVEKTKTMQSVHGRAAYYSEKSIGRQDPGATAVMYIFQGIAKTY
ncbi:dihydroxyacetone kinase subunit DhaL [Anaerosinus sp.]|uniref:dihydroxyacetone kinase subunit DhaL n=1 Tax=Selenobaculum sp. TaxID=3074374 RepID=UPI0015AB469B